MCQRHLRSDYAHRLKCAIAFRDYAAWFDILCKISSLNVAFECPKNENGSETFICSKVLKQPYETWNVKMRFDRDVLSCTNAARTYDIFRKMQSGCAEWCINRFDFCCRSCVPWLLLWLWSQWIVWFPIRFCFAILHRQFLPQSTFNLFLIISFVQRIYDYIYCRSLLFHIIASCTCIHLPSNNLSMSLAKWLVWNRL